MRVRVAMLVRLLVGVWAVRVMSAGRVWGTELSAESSSLEWIVAQSRCAAVVSSTSVDGDGAFRVISARVEETLKGDAPAMVRFLFFADGEGHFKLDLAGVGRRYLVFGTVSEKGDGLTLAAPPIDLGKPVEPSFWGLAGKGIERPEELLAAVREEVGQHVSTDVLGVRIALPGRVLMFPRDGRSEALAKKLLGSPDETVQLAAIATLGDFPKAENVEHVRPFLQDQRLTYPAVVISPWSRATYAFRKAAVDSLTRMGATPVPVVLDVPANFYRPVPDAAVLLAGVVMVAMVLVRHRRLPSRRIRVQCIAGLVGIVIVAAWVRSFSHSTEASVTAWRQLHTITLHGGTLRYEVLYGFPLSTPLVYTDFWDDSRTWPGYWPGAGDSKYVPWHFEETRPVHFVDYSPIVSPPPSSRLEASYRSSVFSFSVAWCLVLPAAAIAGPALPGWMRRRRLRRRRKANHCPTCDYDLRGSGDRCPECGAVVSVMGEE